MSDLFHPEVPDDFLDRVFATMALAPRHTFQVLTKRPERMRQYLTATWSGVEDGLLGCGDRYAAVVAAMNEVRPTPLSEWVAPGWPLPNVWLGTSVENARWRTRIDELRHTPAAVRFLSCEPLLGPLTTLTEVPAADMREEDYLAWRAAHEPPKGPSVPLDLYGIDWVIVGGESGPNSRPMDEAWVRDIVAECRRQNVAPYVKQMGTLWAVEHEGRRSHGGDWDRWPEDLRIREWPPRDPGSVEDYLS
jgi:protein gp37